MGDRLVLPGTKKPAFTATRAPRPDEHGTVDVYLRRSAPLDAITSYGRTRPYLTREQLAQQHGARADDVAAVRAFAQASGLAVASVDTGVRRVRMTGTWAALGAAFGTKIAVTTDDGKEVFRHVDALSVPAEVGPAIEFVLGLDTTPRVRRQGTWASGTHSIHVSDAVAHYGLPTKLDNNQPCDGGGQTVALLQFGATFDVNSFTSTLTGKGLPVPTLHVRTDLETGTPAGWGSDEAMGDALMVAQTSSGATIIQWLSTDFTAPGVVAAVTTAAHDTTNPATVMSMSYAWSGWSDAEVESIDSAYQDAAALGITCLNASGDNGADGPVYSPADCPHVLAVGGTVIKADGTEVVWNDKADGTGGMASTGGYSSTFAFPAWQSGVIPAGQTKRGVPDVSAHCDSYDGMLGTSMSSPFWAGLIARLNQLRHSRLGGRIGLAAPELYASRALFFDITIGNNGVAATVPGTQAVVGWDAATGLGTPTAALCNALGKVVWKELHEIVKLVEDKHWKPEVDLKPIFELGPSWENIPDPGWLQQVEATIGVLEQATAQMRAFIRPEQRPKVGDAVLANAAAERDKPKP